MGQYTLLAEQASQERDVDTNATLKTNDVPRVLLHYSMLLYPVVCNDANIVVYKIQHNYSRYICNI